MPPKRQFTKKTLKLDCEWGSCQESFSRMENFCKHAETHLNASDGHEEDEEEAEGDRFFIVKVPLPPETWRMA